MMFKLNNVLGIWLGSCGAGRGAVQGVAKALFRDPLPVRVVDYQTEWHK